MRNSRNLTLDEIFVETELEDEKPWAVDDYETRQDLELEKYNIDRIRHKEFRKNKD